MIRLSKETLAAAVMAALLSPIAACSAIAEGVVNIYSYREPALMKPLLSAFTAKTGIRTSLIFGRDGLSERLAAEGANSPADVLLTVDIGRLADAKGMGLAQPVTSPAVLAAVPQAYRDADGHWIGLSQRARVVFASKARVAQDVITYEQLADPKWKGKICMRSGQHAYNVGLLASIIAHNGPEKAEAWTRGLKANLARKPAGGDRDQAKAIFSGECDLAVANTYYMAAMQQTAPGHEQQQWAAAIKLLFPNAGDRGTHVDISGVVLAKHAPNRGNGLALIEFLVSEEGQRLYAESVNEYPLRPGVAASPLVAGWGALKPDGVPLDRLAQLRKAASEMMDRVGFDAGPGN